MVFHSDIGIKSEKESPQVCHDCNIDDAPVKIPTEDGLFGDFEPNSSKTTIPFFKGNELDYKRLISWISESADNYWWIIFVFIVVFVISAVSNGANLTDGLDGLATGSSAIIGATLAIFA